MPAVEVSDTCSNSYSSLKVTHPAPAGMEATSKRSSTRTPLQSSARNSAGPDEPMTRSAKPESLTRHERDCRVCRHPKREEIEQDFIAWQSPGELALQYRIPTRAIY